MRPTLSATFKGVVEGKTHTDGRKIFKAVATTPALDRYGEVVLPKGVMLENFMKNPVLLEVHNYSKTSVGRIISIDVSDDAVTTELVFSSDERGAELQAKYEAGDMNAFSIGFAPVSKVNIWNRWEDPPEDLKSITVELPDGSKQEVDLTKYHQIPYTVYNKWDLLELSAVPVPANPEALLLREADEIINRAASLSPANKSFARDQVKESLEPVLRMLAEFNEKFAGGEVKIEGAVASHSTPVNEGSWSGSAARTALAKWASSDGSGSKEKINWSKYSKGFGWFDSAAADSFGSYKLPHHTISDGSLVAVWRGVTAAMAALLGARGGVDIGEGDRGAVYRHLSHHYKDFDKEPPEMKSYTDEELKEIEDAPLVVESTVREDAQPAASADLATTEPQDPINNAEQTAVEQIKSLRSVAEEIDKKVSRILTDVSEEIICLNLKMSMIEDYLATKSAEKPQKPEEKRKKETEVLFEISPDTLGALEKFTSAPK